jgi:translation initiation factor 6
MTFIKQMDFLGSPYLGVFMNTNNEYTLVPPTSPRKLVENLEKTLRTEVLKVTISNSVLIGIFTCMNDNGVLVPETIYRDEVEELEKHFDNVQVIPDFTAIGNLVNCNNKGGVCSPLISKESVKKMKRSLKLEEMMSVRIAAGVDVTGSCVACNNRGFMAHINVSESTFEELEKIFSVKSGASGTVNYGDPFVKAGMLVNDNGCVVGTRTSPFELGRIDEGLFFDKEG